MLTKNSRECNVLDNRAKCMNAVHDYANKIQPLLVESLAEGFRLTNGYQLYQKDKDRVQAIIDGFDGKLTQGSSGRRGSSAWLRCDQYSITLEITDNYPERYHNDGSNGHTCTYYKRTVYLWNNQEGKAHEAGVYTMTSLEEMEKASARLKVVEEEASKLSSEKSVLRCLLGK